MKPNIIHSIAVCLAAFALPFMVACSSQEESLPEVERNIQAVFTLDLGDAANRKTRATPTDGEYDSGSGLENFIDLTKKNFRCYLFGLDNNFVSALEVAGIYNLGENKYSIRLRLKDTGEIRNALTTGCRFVFLANWGSYIEPIPGMTIEELCSSSVAKFEFSQQKTQLSETNLIPMYGVREFEDGVQDFKDGKEVSDIGTLYLLRAYAKVDVNVIFKDFADSEQLKVTSVSLTHSSSKGYKAPKNVIKQGQYVTGSWFTDYTPVNIPNDATDIPLALTKEESTGHYVAYVPEYRNVNDSKEPVVNPSRIKICFTIGDIEAGGREVEGYVDFRYSDTPPTGVSSGQYFDIARNNWYKFDVTVKGKDIDWTVDVIPFTSVELKPDLGLEREEFTGYIVGKDSQGRDCWYDGNYYDPKKAVPLYLGPKDNQGEFVTINGKEYLLVYADYEYVDEYIYNENNEIINKITKKISGYERTAYNLHHIYEKESGKKYLLTPEGITGYKNKNDQYLNKLQQWVWLDSGGDPSIDADARSVYEALQKVGLELKCCRILYEWDRLDWNKARWWGWTGVYPRFWFDIFGNRYPWSEGDTREKRIAILGEEWIKYLE